MKDYIWGNYDEKLLKIELTLLDSPSLTSEVMSDEILDLSYQFMNLVI